MLRRHLSLLDFLRAGMLLLVWDYNNTHCHRHYHRLLLLCAVDASELRLVLAQNASLTTEARRHRMVPRDHNDGFMALYDAFFPSLFLSHTSSSHSICQ